MRIMGRINGRHETFIRFSDILHAEIITLQPASFTYAASSLRSMLLLLPRLKCFIHLSPAPFVPSFSGMLRWQGDNHSQASTISNVNNCVNCPVIQWNRLSLSGWLSESCAYHCVLPPQNRSHFAPQTFSRLKIMYSNNVSSPPKEEQNIIAHFVFI